MAWLLLAGVVAALLLRHLLPNPVRLEPLPGVGEVPYVDGFQIIRFPELPPEGSRAQEGVRRMSEWLRELRKAGFWVRPFSEVMTRVRQGKGLPLKTVVVVFDPAYRTTVEQARPLLETWRTPALWITHLPGVFRTDRRFVSTRTRRELAAEPWWDVALSAGENGFVLETEADAAHRFFRWSSDSGTAGFNTGRSPSGLTRLHANAEWSAMEFLDRLSADLPVRERKRLTVRRIQDRLWGVAVSAGAPGNFDLEVPSDQRTTSVTWEGTRGIRDLELELGIGNWFGEVWLHLRADRTRQELIRVGLMGDRVRVIEERGEALLGDSSAPLVLGPDGRVGLRLRLEGDTLAIQTCDGSERIRAFLHLPGSDAGRFELVLYDRVRGAAVARDISLVASPRSTLSPP